MFLSNITDKRAISSHSQRVNTLDYEFHYIPGPQSVVADALSWSSASSRGEEMGDADPEAPPPGFAMHLIAGGGDSSFKRFALVNMARWTITIV